MLFPAAGYIELGLAAAHLSLGMGTLDVDDFEILRPLAIPAHADPLVQTAVDAKDGTFEIRSRGDCFADEWTAHVRGRLSRSDARAVVPACNLAELSARMPHAVSGDTHYAGASSRGLEYGPFFQGVRSVLLTPPGAAQREALAEIHLPVLEGAPLDGYRAHPGLLDSCIQVLITLIAQNEAGDSCTIPVQVKRVRSIAPLPSRIFCRVLMRRESVRSAVADFEVMDGSGNLLLTIEEARCQKVNFRKPAPTPLLGEWWRPDTAVVAKGALAPLPSPEAICASIALKQERILAQTDRVTFYTSIAPRLEELAGAYAVQTLASLDLGDTRFDLPQLARKAQVRRKEMPLLTLLVRMAEEDGQLIAHNGLWSWNAERTPASPSTLWRALFSEHPRYQAELLLLAQAGEGLLSRLHGEDAPDTASLCDQLYDTAPFQATYNQLLRADLASLAAAWPADRPMRVLEIAAGSAGLTSWALAAFPAERVDYLCTDPSDAAIARATRRLQAHSFVRFAVLDLDRDFIAQDQPAGYFDLVIGSHLPATASTARALLSRLSSVMAADAHLLLLQPHRSRFAEMAGLALAGSAEEWTSVLANSNFKSFKTLDDSAACLSGQTPQQSILHAQRGPAKLPSQPTAAPEVSRHFLILAEPEVGTLLDETVSALHAQGQQTTIHRMDDTELLPLIEGAKANEVVLLTAPSDDPANLLGTETRRALQAVALVRAMEETRQKTPATLTFVVRGAFPTANGQSPFNPAQAALWGLGRVIGNEQTGLDIRLIDQHTPSAPALADELIRRDSETEVQLSAGHRYVNREHLVSLPDEARKAAKPATSFSLDFQRQGGLDSLHLRQLDRRTPSGNQIEIAVKAAGLNFRDVLWTMGMLPEEAVEHGFSGPTIGMECSGEVVRVGSEVTTFKPGDRVVAFASSCFASHVTTDAGSAALIPDAIDYAAAATIPTAFLTAFYALDTLARLQPGETILIHGAAGGVGLAAIQIAKLKGAKVIGTAGSQRKRRMLEMLGVDHALNSRSLGFADEVMQLTGGLGVDVVLNSLAGEAITKSLECLRPFGRFLEIGKRDLYANSRIGLRPFRNNLSYFGIDADTLLIERVDLARKVFQEVIAHFADGRLHPLPFQEIPISRAAEAFRAMQQSRHVGKLILSMQTDQPSSLAVLPTRNAIRPGVTYLVTGGLGGFGLATAAWLVEQGATSLALLSRSGSSSAEARTGIARLTSMGARVRAFAVDIADEGALASALTDIRSTMAPLRGVIHSAAVIEDAPILKISAEQVDRVYRPKMLGAWNLHQATLKDPLETFVLFSSSSAVVGNPGQGAYVAANLYLDALALFRKARGLPALSVGWGAIKDAGFLTRHQNVAEMMKSRTGLDATPSSEALADLGRLLAAGSTRVAAARFDLLKLSHMVAGARVPRFAPIIPNDVADSMESQETLADLLLRTPAAERRSLVNERVKEHAARVIGTGAAQIKLDQTLAELGLDSLMAVELAMGLERDLGKPVSVMQLLSGGSLASIAELILKLLDVETAAEPAAEKVVS